MSNYRVRQVLAIKPKLSESKLRLAVALATWMTDDSMTVEVGFDEIMRLAQLARNTARDARKALAADGYLSWTSPRGRGNRTAWTFHRLPELKGVSGTDPFSGGDGKGVSDVDPLSVAEKGSTEARKRGQPERADLQGGGDRLNRQAKPLSQADATANAIRAAAPGVTDDEIEAFIAKITPKCRTGNVARFVAGFSASDIAAQIAAIRKERKSAKHQADKAEIGKFREWARKQAACEHGQPGGDLTDPGGTVLCPKCRRGLPADRDEPATDANWPPAEPDDAWPPPEPIAEGSGTC